MRLMKIISIIFLFICITFGAIGGCGDDDDGGDIDQLCDEFLDALCERVEECDEEVNFNQCVEIFEPLVDCDTVDGLPDPDQCIADLDTIDCEALDVDDLLILPDSCQPVGTCDICETDADCPDDLMCFACTEDCTGEVDRCTWIFNVECPDGIFRTQQ